MVHELSKDIYGIFTAGGALVLTQQKKNNLRYRQRHFRREGGEYASTRKYLRPVSIPKINPW